ncbi:cyclohex-1-ene-1-carboxyl-CoA hydratase-like protein [Leptotrombidium deliense]|uniref:Cyclohex-1-ene-1-carboxyl-CoA hydratase-like protein n=1 Tax=Leptotrombidium deliense TaxID=299467 RepID=A0A443S0A8_9ACAR|nr:cyclohex-1-ene-1-carboxyl-CoA hydratase-like protein [Leptotrombidium deliense]
MLAFGTIALHLSRNFRLLRNFSIDASQHLIIEKKGKEENVAVITINRPKSLNALNRSLVIDLIETIKNIDNDNKIAAIVVTGNQKAFAGENHINN